MNNIPQPPNVEENCPYVIPEHPNIGYTNQQSELNVARVDRFKIVLDVPCLLQPILKKENRFCNGGNIDRLQMAIWGYVVPDIVVDIEEKPYAGQTLKFSKLSRASLPNVDVNFSVDNRFDNYFILWKWIELQNNAITSRPDSSGLLPDYATTFSVFSFDEYDNKNPVARWNYFGAFPVKIGALKADYRNTQKSELETEFTFAYSQVQMQLL